LKGRALHRGTVREKHAADKLLIDCDQHAPNFAWLNGALHHLGLTPRALYYAPSSTAKHWHVVIYIRERLPILATLFVQLYLRSDRERERNGFIRAYHYGRRDSLVQILFEQKL
jgi:hypothetical protein